MARCALLSLQSHLLKVIVVDTHQGGAAFLFAACSCERIETIMRKAPSSLEELFDFLGCLDWCVEEGSLELLWDVCCLSEREWIDAYPCDYTMDLRDLSESFLR